MHTQLIPIKTQQMTGKFDLFKTIVESIDNQGQRLRDRDVLAISGKFVAMSQGNFVELSSVIPRRRAFTLAKKFGMDAKLVELVLDESDYVYNGIEGFILAVKNGVIAPNAGIDKSNVQRGFVILHPSNAFRAAEDLRKKILSRCARRVGIVITDSRLMPLRVGTVGVAIAVAGFEPVEDLRGKKDLFGKVLKVTRKATADGIATAANMIMGESNESTPIVIVRNMNARMREKKLSWKDLAIPRDQCIYIRGLRERS